MKNNNKQLTALRSRINSFVAGCASLENALEKLIPDYTILFVEYCIKNKACTIKAGSKLLIGTLHDTLTWQSKGNQRMPVGTFIAWCRFLFPEIPEKREDYKKNALYRRLEMTIHPKAMPFLFADYGKKKSSTKTSTSQASKEKTAKATEENYKKAMAQLSNQKALIESNGELIRVLFSALAFYTVRDNEHTPALHGYIDSSSLITSERKKILKDQFKHYIKIEQDIQAQKAQAKAKVK